MEITTVGLDLAKSVFTLHGVDAHGRTVLRKTVRRAKLQAILAVHRVRQGLVEERTAPINRVRGLLTEYGLVSGVGRDRLRKALPMILEDAENGVPGIAREVFADAARQLAELDVRIGDYDRRIAHWRGPANPRSG